ncbi:cupin domain-containing protein [Kitasatospora sp. NPDC088779]|uniref:cupin domain-containing protein n=1 Tax=Kitasatospora sp. NPDC088779 TaxID=3154964 RepID=UPI00342048EE
MRFDITHRDNLEPVSIAPGITARRFPSGPDGAAVLQVDFTAGAKWPSLDVHDHPEIIFVQSGNFHDGTRIHGEGTYIYGHPGSEHYPQSATGCRLLVILPNGDAAAAA